MYPIKVKCFCGYVALGIFPMSFCMFWLNVFVDMLHFAFALCLFVCFVSMVEWIPNVNIWVKALELLRGYWVIHGGVFKKCKVKHDCTKYATIISSSS